MADLRLIVGLGNPGKDYELTRHNCGFFVVHQMVAQFHLKLRLSRIYRSWIAEGRIADQDVFLLLPATFMNNSGQAVRKVVEKYNIGVEDILVICDDFHLDFGQLRIRRGGSSGGHNGLDSILCHLGTKDFSRLRVGIGVPPGRKDPAVYVLEKFSAKEKKELGVCIQEAVDCCLVWLTKDMEKVMSQFNKRKQNG